MSQIENKYIGDFQSLKAHNSMPIIFIEEGFSEITSHLLGQRLVVAVYGERKLSSNLEVYL